MTASEKELLPQLAFLVNETDTANPIRAVVYPDSDSDSYRVCVTKPGSKRAGFFARVFLFAARAHILAAEAEERGVSWPIDLVSEDKAPLFRPNDPEQEFWEPFTKGWSGIVGHAGRPSYVPESLRRPICCLFPKHGSTRKPVYPPVVTVAYPFTPHTVLFCSLSELLEKTGLSVDGIDGQNVAIEHLYAAAFTGKASVTTVLHRLLARECLQHDPDSWYRLYPAAIDETIRAIDQRLVKHFIPLNLIQEVCSRAESRSEAEGPPTFPQPTVSSRQFHRHNEILSRYTHAVIVGGPGAGKTSIMLQMTREWLDLIGSAMPMYIAIFVPLKRFGEVGDFRELVGRAIENTLARIADNDYSSVVRKWLRSPLSKGENVVFILDGYNEILAEDRQRFKSSFDEFRATRKSRFLVSTRAEALEGYLPDFIQVTLDTPTPHQVRKYLEDTVPGVGANVYDSQIEHTPALFSMAQIPFFLNLMAQYVKVNGLARLPPNRAALIDRMVKQSIGRKEDVEAVPLPKTRYPQDDVQKLLENVAHHLLLADSTRHRRGLPTLPGYDAFHVQQMLRYAEVVGMLESSGYRKRTSIRFVHDLVRDYFAACYMSKCLKEEPDVFLGMLRTKYLEYMKWDESLLMLADLMDDPECAKRLIECIAQADVFLAARFCVRSRYTDASIVAPIIRLLSWHAGFFFNEDNQPLCDPYALGAEVLSNLDTEMLLALLTKVPVESFIWGCLPIALCMKPGDVWRRLPNCPLPAVPKGYEGIVEYRLIKGLSYIGHADALRYAVDYLRELPAMMVEAKFILWGFHCAGIFEHWNAPLNKDQVNDLLLSATPNDPVWFTMPLLAKMGLYANDLPFLLDLLARIKGSFLGDTFTQKWFFRALSSMASAKAESLIVDSVKNDLNRWPWERVSELFRNVPLLNSLKMSPGWG